MNENELKILKEAVALEKERAASLKSQLDTAAKLSKEYVGSKKSSRGLNKNLSDSRKEVDKLIAESKKSINSLSTNYGKFLGTSSTGLERLGRDAENMAKRFEKALDGAAKRGVASFNKEVDKIKKRIDFEVNVKANINQLKKGTVGYGTKGLRQSKAAWGLFKDAAKSGDRRKLAEAQVSFGRAAKTAKGPLKALNSGLGFLSGTIKKLLGPIGWAIMALEALQAAFEQIKKYDKYKTDVAKNYRGLAGPVFGADNFKRGVSDFGDHIHRAGVDFGFSKDDMTEFYKSIKDGGLTFQGYVDNVGNADNAVKEFAKATYEMGIDFSQTGQYFSDIAVEMRGSLGDLTDAFHRVANDAKAAGIDQNRFYNTVMQSTLAVSTYGNFIESASKNLRAFTKAGSMSQSQADEAAKSFTTMFDQMAPNARLVFTEMLQKSQEGGLRGMVGRRADELKSQLDDKTITGSKRKKLQSEFNILADMKKMDKADLSTAVSANLPMFTDIAQKATLSHIESTLGTDWYKGSMEFAGGQLGILGNLGISGDHVKHLAGLFRGFESTMGILKDNLSETGVKDVLSKNKGAITSGKMTSDELKKALTDGGVSEGVAKVVVDAFSTSLAGSSALAFGKDNMTAKDAASIGMKSIEHQLKDSNAMDEENAKAMANQVTSIEKYLGMQKDAIDWNIANTKIMTDISDWTKMGAKATIRMANKYLGNSNAEALYKAQDKMAAVNRSIEEVKKLAKERDANKITEDDFKNKIRSGDYLGTLDDLSNAVSGISKNSAEYKEGMELLESGQRQLSAAIGSEVSHKSAFTHSYAPGFGVDWSKSSSSIEEDQEKLKSAGLDGRLLSSTLNTEQKAKLIKEQRDRLQGQGVDMSKKMITLNVFGQVSVEELLIKLEKANNQIKHENTWKYR